ncbi:monooxygenase [Streptomyces xanthochromogenes]|uniref:FAD-dependent oxidoreductase n=1 Tax=Streptomyces xanthochromogenes TaxID=67384 RepID=UPI003424BE45
MGGLDGHAVVIGGSMGGLMAARVLAGRFARVTVVDRDELPLEARARRGVPHAEHGHALLLSGKRALEELYPGLSAELVAEGAVAFDPGQDLLLHQMGAFRERYRSGQQGISLTRPLLEAAVRRRTAAMAGISIRDGVAVDGLTGAAGRVDGVRLADGTRLPADLVVNASGRGGAGADGWLTELGCAVPDVDAVKIDVGYTTRLLHRAPGERLPGGALLHLMAGVPPQDRRAAAVFAVEGDRWMVTLGGWHQAHAPVDPEGFAAFAAALPSPLVRDVVARARPVDGEGPARKFTFPYARRRRFERLTAPPAGFVALGDALCSFNPLYGQGMSVAALEALALGRVLERTGDTSTRTVRAYFAAAARIVDAPWRLATGGDFAHPLTRGPKAPGTDLVNGYVRRALLASHVSAPVNRTLVDIQQLLVPPTALLRPTTLARILLSARHSPALGRSPGAPPVETAPTEKVRG